MMRCKWCDIRLRWWQYIRGYCELCWPHLIDNSFIHNSPPCHQGSRKGVRPDLRIERPKGGLIHLIKTITLWVLLAVLAGGVSALVYAMVNENEWLYP